MRAEAKVTVNGHHQASGIKNLSKFIQVLFPVIRKSPVVVHGVHRKHA